MAVQYIRLVLLLCILAAGCYQKNPGTDTGGGPFTGQTELTKKLLREQKSSTSRQANTAAEPHKPFRPENREETAGMNQKRPPRNNPETQKKTPDTPRLGAKH